MCWSGVELVLHLNGKLFHLNMMLMKNPCADEEEGDVAAVDAGDVNDLDYHL